MERDFCAVGGSIEEIRGARKNNGSEALSAYVFHQPSQPDPVDLMGGPDQPECLRGFTRWEIERASEFLVRLGLIKKPGRQQRGNREPA